MADGVFANTIAKQYHQYQHAYQTDQRQVNRLDRQSNSLDNRLNNLKNTLSSTPPEDSADRQQIMDQIGQLQSKKDSNYNSTLTTLGNQFNASISEGSLA